MKVGHTVLLTWWRYCIYRKKNSITDRLIPGAEKLTFTWKWSYNLPKKTCNCSESDISEKFC